MCAGHCVELCESSIELLDVAGAAAFGLEERGEGREIFVFVNN